MIEYKVKHIISFIILSTVFIACGAYIPSKNTPRKPECVYDTDCEYPHFCYNGHCV